MLICVKKRRELEKLSRLSDNPIETRNLNPIEECSLEVTEVQHVKTKCLAKKENKMDNRAKMRKDKNLFLKATSFVGLLLPLMMVMMMSLTNKSFLPHTKKR